MHLSRLELRNFRNLSRIELDLPEGLVLFWGENAQGKTNLLEAIYFLATGRSFRTRNERECIAWNAGDDNPTILRGRVERAQMTRDIRVVLYQGAKRLFLDGATLTRLAELFGEMNAVLFTPADLQIVQSAPSARRRFIDLEISQFSRPYLNALQQYAIALKQRNALLRSDRPLEQMAGEFEPYEALMADSAMEIQSIRQSVLAELAERASAIYAAFGSGETMGLVYRHCLRHLQDEEDAGLAPHEAYRWRLSQDRQEDRRMGGTRMGPHRDDFLITLDGRSAQEFGSQGQQRSCVLALRVAEVALMEARTGHRPILLLDDLASELDPGRRARLLEMLKGKGQVFLTTTRREDFPVDLAASFEVSEGQVLASTGN